MNARSLVVAMTMVLAMPLRLSLAGATPSPDPPRPRTGSLFTRLVGAPADGRAGTAAQSVPDGAGGQYVLWSDARDGDLDLYLLRVTNTGAPASGWPADGLVVCDAAGDQMEGAIFPDGTGGVLVGWPDPRDDMTLPDIYVQRVSPAGVPQWAANGVRVLEGGPLIADVNGAADGAGGVLVSWITGAPGARDVYALRFAGTGTVAPGWDPAGEIVCIDPDEQGGTVITDDGAGGAVIAWLDFRGGEQHVYAQRLDASGTAQWTANGIAIDDPAHTANFIAIAPAGGGHTVVAWESEGAAFAQRLDASGAAQWAGGGVTLHPGGAPPAEDLHAIPDGLGGTLLAWRSVDSGGAGRILTQRVDDAGALPWGANGTEVVQYADETPGEFDLASDGAGGAYFAWEDWNSGDVNAEARIRAQRVMPAGTVAWATGGVAATTTAFSQRAPLVALDGAGGALVSWTDLRGLDPEIVSQRFTPAGASQLDTNGVAGFVNPGVQIAPLAVQTPDGGVLVVWSEKRNGMYDVRARKLDENGNPATPTTLVSGSPGHQTAIGFIEDGAGGGIVAWFTHTSIGPLLFAQRLDANAAPQWAANGVAVCTAPGSKSVPQMVSDGMGGAIFAWSDDRAGFGDPFVYDPDIFAQRVTAAGTAAWAANGVAVRAFPGLQSNPAIAADGAGGAIVAWSETFALSWEVVAQRLNANGVAQWTGIGVPIATFGGFPGVMGAASGGGDGAVFLIREQTYSVLADEIVDALHVQKVDGSGALPWGSPTLVCFTGNQVALERIIDDGGGGAFVAWSDNRNLITDVYIQHVAADGDASWGANGNVVCDAPGFQWIGGLTRSGADAFVTWSDRRNGQADVYAQRMDATGAAAWTPNGVVVSDAPFGQSGPGFAPWRASTPDRLYLAWTDNRLGGERIAYVQRLDSSGLPQWTADGVTETEVSLASVEAEFDRVRLAWHAGGPVTATVYRRTDEGPWIAKGAVSADGTGRIAFEDRDVVPGARHGYRLGVLDGAAERFAGEAWVVIPGAPALALDGLRPSPALGTLSVSFTLAHPGHARLDWLDIAGRLVRTDEFAALGAGRHVVRLEGAPPPPGVYVLRLTQSGRTVTSRAAVMR